MPGIRPSSVASASSIVCETWPVVTRRWPFGEITICTTVPTGTSGERSCETARTFLPAVISSTGRFINTRLLRRRTPTIGSAFQP